MPWSGKYDLLAWSQEALTESGCDSSYFLVFSQVRDLLSDQNNFLQSGLATSSKDALRNFSRKFMIGTLFNLFLI